MFSVKGDVVLDPFLGAGTTTAAAMATARNSIGFEIDPSLWDTICSIKRDIVDFANKYIGNRITRHLDFVENRVKTRGPLKHTNNPYGFPVMTTQERELVLNDLENVKDVGNQTFEVSYFEEPQPMFCKSL